MDSRVRAVLDVAVDLPTFERSSLVTTLLLILDGGDEQSVLEAALKLTPDERWQIVDEVMGTLKPADYHADLHPSWDAEIARRIADIDNPDVQWLTAAEFLARLGSRSG